MGRDGAVAVPIAISAVLDHVAMRWRARLP
jgi:hypothetical protein